MFVQNDDLSIYCTRGDCGEFTVKAMIDGELSVFASGDVLRLKVFEKKGCDTVVMQRDFAVEEDADSFVISLTASDTKIGEIINKPTDYWYEVELNPETHPQTIIGYDEDGPKVFKLFPEGEDVNAEDIEKVGSKTLQELVDYALEQAKESGEFKGEKGDPGDKGEPGDATDIGLEKGEAEYSVKQSRHPASSQNHAYQRGGVSLGGNTQAGVTEEEYNASDKYKQWDGTKFLEWLETFGFQLSWGDGSKARGRNSMAGNEGCEANAKNSSALGLKVIVDFLNGFGAGQYNENLPDSLVEFGCGNSGWKQNGFAMDTTGTIKTRTVRPKASGSFDLGASNFVWRYIYAFYIKAQSSIETPLITADKAKVTTAPTEDTDAVRLKDLNEAIAITHIGYVPHPEYDDVSNGVDVTDYITFKPAMADFCPSGNVCRAMTVSAEFLGSGDGHGIMYYFNAIEWDYSTSSFTLYFYAFDKNGTMKKLRLLYQYIDYNTDSTTPQKITAYYS
ncbi:MAG: hypothetical protein IJ404_05700 [Clostridia bacterium]|nr:hypothetical protein [Clostridia bacterium]